MQHSKAVHAHLFCTGQKRLVHIVQIANATTHSKRNKQPLCNLADHFHVARTIFGTRGNIVKDQFIDTVVAVSRPHFNWVANVNITLKLYTLRDLAVTDIQTDN